jgi:alpha-tubulin suppressor-like RCC1 family protein
MMKKSLKYKKFHKIVSKYFKNNIELTFATKTTTIILTKDDKIYNFNITTDFDLLINPTRSRIESALMEEICYKGVVHIEAGHFHFIVRTKEGKLYCWGDNNFGQLGNGTLNTVNNSKDTPVLIECLKTKNIIYICCGVRHSLALTVEGDVYSWGDNTYRQIGNGTFEKYQTIPLKIHGFKSQKVKAIACGGYHSLALTENNELFSWGNNKSRQLGFESYETMNTPTQVLIDFPIEKICCGGFHSLLLSKDGFIYVIGDIFFQKSFQKTSIKSSVINKVECLEKFNDIAAHPTFSDAYGFSNDKFYYMWGCCGRNTFDVPKKTKFKSFNNIFTHLYGVTLMPIKGFPYFQKSLFTNGYYEDNYKEIKKIGEGSYGYVYKVKDYFQDLYAMKKIMFKIDKFDNLLKEIKISQLLRKQKNEYLVDYKKTWIEESDDLLDGSERNVILYILMDLFEKTLDEILNEIRNLELKSENETYFPICYFVFCQIFIQVLEGVNYLHEQNPPLIHRDLNPKNILLDKKLSGRFVKIADFNLSTLHEFAEQSHTKDVGAPKYTAPEVIRSREYGIKADIYSLGVIMENLFDLDVNRLKIFLLSIRIRNCNIKISMRLLKPSYDFKMFYDKF